MLAAGSEKEVAFKYLIDQGADIDVKDNDGETSMHYWAGGKGLTVKVADILIKNGISIDAKDNRGFTPLMLAAHRGKEGKVKYLIDKGADISAIKLYGLDDESSSFSSRRLFSSSE